jgi:hypothetical protein
MEFGCKMLAVFGLLNKGAEQIGKLDRLVLVGNEPEAPCVTHQDGKIALSRFFSLLRLDVHMPMCQ